MGRRSDDAAVVPDSTLTPVNYSNRLAFCLKKRPLLYMDLDEGTKLQRAYRFGSPVAYGVERISDRNAVDILSRQDILRGVEACVSGGPRFGGAKRDPSSFVQLTRAVGASVSM